MARCEVPSPFEDPMITDTMTGVDPGVEEDHPQALKTEPVPESEPTDQHDTSHPTGEPTIQQNPTYLDESGPVPDAGG